MLLILLLVSACFCFAEVSYGDQIIISASPETLVLDGSTSYSITVHTDLRYSSAYTATINGVDASTFADDRGNLVARASIPEDALSVGTLVVELVVSDEIGVIGSGTDTIAVIDKHEGPQPGKTDPGSEDAPHTMNKYPY
jgi:hypothetical protein